MKLLLKNRINITVLLPQSGNILEQMTCRDIVKKVEISAEERKEVDLKQVGDRIAWDVEKDKGKEVEFTATEITFLKDQVTRLDKESKVTSELLDICLIIKEWK